MSAVKAGAACFINQCSNPAFLDYNIQILLLERLLAFSTAAAVAKLKPTKVLGLGSGRAKPKQRKGHAYKTNGRKHTKHAYQEKDDSHLQDPIPDA